jgi:DNA-binding ferritin-like protein
VVVGIRQRIDRVAVDDPVTCDQLIQVAATLEKQLWLVHAQIMDAVRQSGSRFLNGAGGS